LGAEIATHLAFQLELGLVDMEVHAGQALQLQGHVEAEDIGGGAG
jgi:hypothetical protein